MKRFFSTKTNIFPPTIRQLLLQNNLENQQINLQGWVQTKRKSKSICFVHLKDGTQSCQLTIDPLRIPNFDQIWPQIQLGASIKASGIWKKSLGTEQSHELEVDEIQLIGTCEKDFPIQKKDHSLDHYRQILAYRHRAPLFEAVFRIRNTLTMAIHEFFQKHDFYDLHTPIFTGNDCEGAGETFSVKNGFFPNQTHLTVSSQLHLEMLMSGLGRVYTLSPCFRADIGSETSSRHLAEFYMLESEWAFIDQVSDLTKVVESLVKEISQKVLQKHEKDLRLIEQLSRPFLNHQKWNLEQRIRFLEGDFQTISYSDAISLLNKHAEVIKWGDGLHLEQERKICQLLNQPVFVTDYPKDIKPFYMRSNSDQKTVACFDFLLPSLGEVVGGSIREWDYDSIKGALKDQKGLDWYLNLRKYGSCPHGGFGLGFDRLLMYLTGLENIRDVVPLPRYRGKCQF